LKLGDNERVTNIIYRMPISNGPTLQYSCYPITSDDDVRIMMDCHSMFAEVKILELYIETTRVGAIESVVPCSRDEVGPSGGSYEGKRFFSVFYVAINFKV